MYKTMLVFKDPALCTRFEEMHSRVCSDDFIIGAVLYDGYEAYKKLCREQYDLVICDTGISDPDCLTLLKRTVNEGLCAHVAFCSHEPDFEYARLGMIHGAFDYFAEPFKDEQLCSAFARLKGMADSDNTSPDNRISELLELFEKRDDSIYDRTAAVFDSSSGDSAEIYRQLLDIIYKRHEWLDLYISHDSLENGGIKENINELFGEYCELFPAVNNETIEQVILYILNNPESDLKQKTIASEFYINSSYLSTVFSAQTQHRFVDYLTTVKLKRAGWLLLNTDLKIADISARLDYKDIGYFSRVFKKKYGMTPSEYKMPDDYTFQI